jgi:hypothetical protein
MTSAGVSAQELHADEAEAARADGHDPVAGFQQLRRAPHGVVRREPRVGEPRDVRRPERGVHLQQGALAGAHELGEAAVGRQPWVVGPLAVRVVPAPARPAEPAGHERVRDDRVTDRDRRHGRPDLVDPARVLVPDDERQPRRREVPHPLEDVQVCAAHAGAADADDDVERALDRRLRHLVEVELVVLVAVDAGGEHQAASGSRSNARTTS